MRTPSVACAADAGKEAQRDADDKRARAADDKEGQRAVDPVDPFGVQADAQHAHQRQQQCRAAQRAMQTAGV